MKLLWLRHKLFGTEFVKVSNGSKLIICKVLNNKKTDYITLQNQYRYLYAPTLIKIEGFTLKDFDKDYVWLYWNSEREHYRKKDNVAQLRIIK